MTEPLRRGNRTATAAEGIARAVILADRRSDAALRGVVNSIPIAELVDVVTALAAYANRNPAPLRIVGEADPHRRKPDTHTADEAREAHARYTRNLRDPWTVAGERQYQRQRKRERRTP